MTKEQFTRQFERLRGTRYGTDTLASTLWHYCLTIPEDSFAKIVSKCLLSGETKFDFQSELDSVKRNRALLEATRLATVSGGVCTENGLKKTLEGIGANSLMEAILKRKRGENETETEETERAKSGRDGRDS